MKKAKRTIITEADLSWAAVVARDCCRELREAISFNPNVDLLKIASVADKLEKLDVEIREKL